ncbi:hypothetical protein [Caproiciproducens sp. LBM24188]
MYWRFLSFEKLLRRIRILDRLIVCDGLEKQICVKGSFCMEECAQNGVCVRIGGNRS